MKEDILMESDFKGTVHKHTARGRRLQINQLRPEASINSLIIKSGHICQ